MLDSNALFSQLAYYSHKLAFFLISAFLLLSPWFFGSWEMHWFWLSAGLLFLSAFFAGVGTLFDTCTHPTDEPQFPFPRFRCEKTLSFLLLSAAPFLLYLFWRLRFSTDPAVPIVAMEAQRCALLFTTPLMVIGTLFLVLNRHRLHLLSGLFLTNSVFLAGNALYSYFTSNGNQILWVDSPFKYNRACSPFFCPNSFVDMMNFALFFALSILVSKGIHKRVRALAALGLPILFAAWFFTLSRGGILSFIATLPVFILFGFRGYKPLTRWIIGVLSFSLVLGGLWALFNVPNPVRARCEKHPTIQAVLHYRENGDEARKILYKAFHYGFDRGIYIDSALRAWRSSPTLGIGPGQHSPRWPQFAASDDGDPTSTPVKFPTLTNHAYHSYEVHSDWVQLLEEFGIVGFSLFLLAAFCWLGALFVSRNRGFSHHHHHHSPSSTPIYPLTAILCTVSLVVHSLGDFSLQIPAVTWTFAALLSFGFLSTLSERGEEP